MDIGRSNVPQCPQEKRDIAIIESILMQTEETAIHVQNLVSQVEKRISPILGCVSNENPAGQGKTGRLPESPLGQKLEMIAATQRGTIIALKSLLDRVEL